jgi:hypothetical protein
MVSSCCVCRGEYYECWSVRDGGVSDRGGRALLSELRVEGLIPVGSIWDEIGERVGYSGVRAVKVGRNFVVKR